MNKKKNFALIGAAGYIAPRHMKAIKDTGNALLAAYDPYDCVGIMDSYFPNADYFTEFERFDRHVDKLSRSNNALDYVSICSPNYLHDSHIRFGLRVGANVICEKPIVLNPWNIDALKEAENNSAGNIYTILQLRHHEAIKSLRKKIMDGPKDKIYDIDLTYLTSRGNWYYSSWKGSTEKSGGIATNIGVHFFDMLTWIFGELKSQKVHVQSHDRAAGLLQLKRANVRWFLSINYDLIPDHLKQEGYRTYRSIKIDGEEIEFSGGFTELHTTSYEAILAGKGYRISDTRHAIQIVHDIRHSVNSKLEGDYHPFAKEKLSQHPFQNRF
jgi:UDP-N-acetyl-2-amino-2-deoxyglucuronate dehydrogenase